MNNKKKYITAILAITAANFSFAQIRTVNSDTVGNAPNSSAFIDVTSNPTINGNPNLGKGLLFPQTDLSLFTTFGGTPFGIPNNYLTYYDGMIVYNTKDGGKAGVGATQGELKPGFWYYENKSKDVNGGTWKQISSPTTNTLSYTGNTLTSTVNGVASSVTISSTGGGIDNPANNGLSKDGSTIQLGGALTKKTEIDNKGNTLAVVGTGRVGVGVSDPTQKLDVDGNIRLRGVTNTTVLSGTDKIMVLDANGVVKKIDVANFQQSVSKMYYKYYIIVKNNGDDWVSNFDTKIPHSKYSVVVTGFDTNLKGPNAGFNFFQAGSSTQFNIPNITPFIEGSTWRLNIDVPNVRPNVASMAWGLKLLIISKDQITDLGSEIFNLGSSITGSDNASPVP
ncbi:hypothetical protein [Chryseobacterium sp. Mn2064]|uniref:hypothetical protein n=1 Tax=Chryseobacterium sp. Mn2064 TaxID=3395263 RepID=UPI003BE95DB2